MFCALTLYFAATGARVWIMESADNRGSDNRGWTILRSWLSPRPQLTECEPAVESGPRDYIYGLWDLDK